MEKPDDHKKLVFRLYISDQAPSSMRAMSNLKTICQDYFHNDYELEVVDTSRDPARAMQDGIIITPTLLKLSPEPPWTIVGDLSEDARVLASMHAQAPNDTGKRVVQAPRGGKYATKRRTGTANSRTHGSTGSRLSPARQERK